MKGELGLVLSGGGVKGAAHAALLEYLDTVDRRPSVISGSSAGALVGALYAAGHSTMDIIEFFRRTPLFKMTWLTTRKCGLFDTHKYEDILRQYLPPTFEDLQMPLYITAVNLEEGKVEYFSSGDLYKPLLASCAVPLLYCPVLINDKLYTDGGVMNNFPIEPIVEQCELLIGSYACQPKIHSKHELNSTLRVTNHASALLLHAANEYKIKMTDHTVIFDLGEFPSFNNKYLYPIMTKAFQLVKNNKQLHHLLLEKSPLSVAA